MRAIREEGSVGRRVAAVLALALVMFVVGGESVSSDNHQFLLCSGPGETMRSNGDAAVAGDYVVIVNSRNYDAIEGLDQVPEGDLENQTDGGSFVRSDLSWGMYIPSGYVYQEAGSQNCVINIRFLIKEKGESYFKEAVVDFDNTAPCQGRVWLNTSRDTSEDAAVCPRGAPAQSSGTETAETTNSNNLGSNTETTNTVNPPQNNNDENPDATNTQQPGNNNGGTGGSNSGSNPGSNSGGTPGNNNDGGSGGGSNPGRKHRRREHRR